MLARKIWCSSSFLAAILTAHGQVNTSNCSNLNYSAGPYINLNMNQTTYQHLISGYHGWSNSMTGSCTYSGTQSYSYVPCMAQSKAGSSSGNTENGITSPYIHQPLSTNKGGLADGAAGAIATSDAEGASAVNSCLILPCGAPTISISGGGTGGGYSVSFGGGNIIFQESLHYSNTCTAYTLAPYPATGCAVPNSPPPNVVQGFEAIWSPATCSWEIEPDGESPIAIDTNGGLDWKGQLFSDPKKGDYVTFSFGGKPMKVSWPKPSSGVAWLALDRDGDGVIKDASELFGNFTPHANADYTGTPNNMNPNGFLALAFYDQPAQGGDGNTIIDKNDKVWSSLRLWFPIHCFRQKDASCQSDPSELYRLEEFGISSISLVWNVAQPPAGGSPASVCTGIGFCDRVGNEFKFQAVLNPLAETHLKNDKGESCCDLHQISNDTGKNRIAYDVWLTAIP